MKAVDVIKCNGIKSGVGELAHLQTADAIPLVPDNLLGPITGPEASEAVDRATVA